MSNENKKTLNYFINSSFFLYFVILLTERLISIILSFVNGIDISSNGFYGYTYLYVFASISFFLIYLVIKCRSNIKALFKKTDDISFVNLSVASGLLLLSGMVHTEYTIPVIQFVSYGILIIGILLQVIINIFNNGNKVLNWLSFSYLVAFSMAIPVMYQSMIELHVLFHVFEAVTSGLLVIVFTFFLILVFMGKDDLFFPLPIIIAVILDSTLIILRWNEEINYFVLIFIILSIVLFVIGYIYKLTRKKKRQ